MCFAHSCTEVSTTTSRPVRDQIKTTLPSKVKVTTVNVVTSPVGITTEETTTVKTTSPPKVTTGGEDIITLIFNLHVYELGLGL